MPWADLAVTAQAYDPGRSVVFGKSPHVYPGRGSWPTVVLAGGVLLSLAANLAQAQPTVWGRIVAAVPPAVPALPPAGTRRCSRRRGGPPPSIRTGTGSRSPATRCAPGSACPTRPPPSCCASSALARACRREPPARPDPGCLPGSAGARGSRREGGCQRGVPAREYGAGVGSTGTAKAWQPTGTGSPATGGRLAASTSLGRFAAGPPAVGAEGRRPGFPGRSAELADRLSGFANLVGIRDSWPQPG
jgi:hypothetical protein